MQSNISVYTDKNKFLSKKNISNTEVDDKLKLAAREATVSVINLSHLRLRNFSSKKYCKRYYVSNEAELPRKIKLLEGSWTTQLLKVIEQTSYWTSTTKHAQRTSANDQNDAKNTICGKHLAK